MYFLAPSAVSYGELVLGLGQGGPARSAQATCEVVVRPSESDPRWREAVSSLRGWLRESAGRDLDCGGVEIRTDGPTASIVFTTSDGRRAERPGLAPSQLLAVMQGLTTTISEPPAQPASPSPQALEDRPRAAVRALESTEARGTHVLIEGRGGMRFPGAAPCSQSPNAESCAFGSLSLGVGVGINVGHWDLGVFGQYDPAQVLLTGSTPPGFAMSAYAVGLRAGRRDRVGPLDAVTGATAAIAVTDESSHYTTNTASGQAGGQAGGPSAAEPRVGIFAGVVVPRRGRVRMRPELSMEIVASRVGRQYRIDVTETALPLLSWWSASASVAIEWEAP